MATNNDALVLCKGSLWRAGHWHMMSDTSFFSPIFIFVSCLVDLLPESVLDETAERAWLRQTCREPVDSTVREAVSAQRSVALACHRPMH